MGDRKDTNRKKAGYLATITSSEENDIISDLISNGSSDQYWIGYTDKDSENNWKWVTGENSSYTNWTSGEPNNDGGDENYAAIGKSGQWNDEENSSKYVGGLIYETDTFSPTKTIYYNNVRYDLYQYPVSWHDAKQLCEDLGGHLVVVTSTDENKAVADLIEGSSWNDYWIGCSDEDNEGEWKWITGEKFEYSNWNDGEPSNSSGIEHFGSYQTSSKKWNDIKKDHLTVGFICEMESENMPSPTPAPTATPTTSPTTDSATVKVSSTTAAAGKTVDVTVDISENKGFANLGLQVGYDTSALTLKSVSNNTSVGATYTGAQSITANPYNMGWDSTDNVTYNGTLATLTFQVNDNVADDTYPITVSYYKGIGGDYTDGEDVNYDADFKSLNLNYVNGAITVSSHIPGDINGDGKVNNQDGTFLLRHLAGWNVNVDESALDVNGDGKVNNQDGTVLLRYLAGWSVTIH